MSEQILLRWLMVCLFLLAAATALVLSFVSAPYGRHSRRGWGPTIDSRLAWIVMESPAPLVFFFCFLVGEHSDTLIAWIFLLMWEAHYVHRSFIYPLRLRSAQKRMPVAIVGLGFLFNLLNGYLNGRYVFTFSGGYPTEWLTDPRFIFGLALFVVGYVINRQADRTLRLLRQNNGDRYAVPYGGMYRWVSCPNYLGEIVEWFGWALATWSLPGLAFAVWTAANLAPRARSHHAWYQAHFDDYPRQRKALLPGLW